MTPDPSPTVPRSTLDALLRSSPREIATAVLTRQGPLYRAIARKHLTDYPVGPLHVPPTRTTYAVRARRQAAVVVLWIADRLVDVSDRLNQ